MMGGGWLAGGYLSRRKKPATPGVPRRKASSSCGVGAGTSYHCVTADKVDKSGECNDPCPRLHSRPLLIHHANELLDC